VNGCASAPELRIVSEELWESAHARLDLSRTTYLRAQGGKLWGRPPSGVASKYLLTGIARCGVCGAGLEVRSRSHGRERVFYYSCSSFYRRGPSICPNRYEIPLRAADAAVIAALLEDLLTPERLVSVVTARLLARAKAATADDTPSALEGVQRELAATQTALGRLTAAVAAGADCRYSSTPSRRRTRTVESLSAD
jgi:hypothetical protein